MVNSVVNQEKYDDCLYRIALPGTYGRFNIPQSKGATAHEVA